MSRAVVLVFALACSKSERSGPSAEEVQLSMSRAMARDSLVSVRAAIERARERAMKPDWSADAYQRMEKPNLEAFMSCRVAARMLPRLRTIADPLVFEIAQLCDHDLPIAELSAAVAAVEADPSIEPVPVSCHFELLVEAGDAMDLVTSDPQLTALQARFRKRCNSLH